MPSTPLGPVSREATGSGRPASSAQADRALSGWPMDSVQSIRPCSHRFPPDMEYNSATTTLVTTRGASVDPRPMPLFNVNIDYVQHQSHQGNRRQAVVRLPTTNLEKVEPPPGMLYNEKYQFDLAMLLEGRAACHQPLPDWSHGGTHYNCSRYLGYATRHCAEAQMARGNWVSIDWLLAEGPTRMCTPSVLFQTVFQNEKQRYQLSRPIYERAQPRRAGQSRAIGQ